MTVTQAQTTDDRFGHHVKMEVGNAMDDWLEVEEHMKEWENGKLTASDRRVLLTHCSPSSSERSVPATSSAKSESLFECILNVFSLGLSPISRWMQVLSWTTWCLLRLRE